MTFTVEKADGLSLGYKLLTPQGFTASITPICLAKFKSLCLFNHWHMSIITAVVLKAKSLFNEVICMCILYICVHTYVQFQAFHFRRTKVPDGWSLLHAVVFHITGCKIRSPNFLCKNLENSTIERLREQSSLERIRFVFVLQNDVFFNLILRTNVK